jgi:hypothetical protein
LHISAVEEILDNFVSYVDTLPTEMKRVMGLLVEVAMPVTWQVTYDLLDFEIKELGDED